jgi:hypothetical protein
MKMHLVSLHGPWSAHFGQIWGLIALGLFILFLTLVVAEKSNKEDK